MQPESDPPPGQMCITTTVCKAQYCRNFTAELQSFVCYVQHATIQVNMEAPPTKGTEFNSGFSVCRESCLRDFYINTPQRSLFFFPPAASSCHRSQSDWAESQLPAGQTCNHSAFAQRHAEPTAKTLFGINTHFLISSRKATWRPRRETASRFEQSASALTRGKYRQLLSETRRYWLFWSPLEVTKTTLSHHFHNFQFALDCMRGSMRGRMPWMRQDMS